MELDTNVGIYCLQCQEMCNPYKQDVDLMMLGHRLRRCANIKPVFKMGFLFTGSIHWKKISDY